MAGGVEARDVKVGEDLAGPDPREGNANSDPSFDSVEKVAALREKIDASSSARRAHCTTLTLRRYLRARQGDVDAAAALAEESIQMHVQEEEECVSGWNGRYHGPGGNRFCFIPIGRDYFGRGVVYGCPARAEDDDPLHTMHHITGVLEVLFACGDAISKTLGAEEEEEEEEDEEGGVSRVEKIVPSTFFWVVDFSGYGLVHATNTSLGTRLANATSTRFPERLSGLILVDAPYIFQAFLAVCRALLDATTMNKVVAVSKSELRGKLESTMPADMAEYIDAMCGAEPAEPGSVPPIPDSPWAAEMRREMQCLRRFFRARGLPLPESEAADDSDRDEPVRKGPWSDEALTHGEAWELWVKEYDWEAELGGKDGLRALAPAFSMIKSKSKDGK